MFLLTGRLSECKKYVFAGDEVAISCTQKQTFCTPEFLLKTCVSKHYNSLYLPQCFLLAGGLEVKTTFVLRVTGFRVVMGTKEI